MFFFNWQRRVLFGNLFWTLGDLCFQPKVDQLLCNSSLAHDSQQTLWYTYPLIICSVFSILILIFVQCIPNSFFARIFKIIFVHFSFGTLLRKLLLCAPLLLPQAATILCLITKSESAQYAQI